MCTAAAVVVLEIFERGSLPLNVGINGMTAGLFGLVLVTMCVAPRGALWLIDAFTAARPGVGRLLRADVQRYGLLFGICAAVLVNGTSLASRALYQPTGADDSFWQRLRDGEIALSDVSAGRLGVTAGEKVELPTVTGPKHYRVAGTFRPRMIDDAAVATNGISRSWSRSRSPATW